MYKTWLLCVKSQCPIPKLIFIKRGLNRKKTIGYSLQEITKNRIKLPIMLFLFDPIESYIILELQSEQPSTGNTFKRILLKNIFQKKSNAFTKIRGRKSLEPLGGLKNVLSPFIIGVLFPVERLWSLTYCQSHSAEAERSIKFKHTTIFRLGT